MATAVLGREAAARADGVGAGRLLRDHLLTQALAEVRRWAAEVEPGLDVTWRRLAGPANTGIRLTPAETRKLEEDMEALLAPYVTRGDADTPEGARRVRVVRFTMPETSDESRPSR